jgi:hypothetical protein
MYFLATKKLNLLIAVAPDGKPVLIDGGLRFRIAHQVGLESFPFRIVAWCDLSNYLLIPPRRAGDVSIVGKVFRFIRFSLQNGKSGVIGHNIPDAGQAAVVIGHIRPSITKKDMDENLRRLRDHGIVNLLRLIHYESSMTPNRPVSDEAWVDRIVWPQGYVNFLPTFYEIKKRHVASAVANVLGVKNLAAARKQFKAELHGCSTREIVAKTTTAKQRQCHLSVAYKIVQAGLVAALEAYRAEENHHCSFIGAVPYLRRIRASEPLENRKNPHLAHTHFHQQHERLTAANMGEEEIRQLARTAGVSLGEHLGREGRDRCLLDWFAAVYRAEVLNDLQIEPMAAYRFIMRRLLATRGFDLHSDGWHELFQFVMTKFDLAGLDRRCFWIATQRHLMV